VDIKDLPVIPISSRNKARLSEIKEKSSKRKRDDNKKSCVVYLGHIPYGFFEFPMKEFLSQFGEVQRLYISKNKKTGRSRGYGFIEFLHPEVAEIVADTMNDYLMYKKKMICKVLPEIKAKNLPWPTNQIVVPNPYAAQRKYAASYNDEKKPITADALVEKERRKRKNLAKKNIDYTFDGYEKLIEDLRKKEKEEQAVQAIEEEKKAEKEQQKQWEERKIAKLTREKEARAEKMRKESKAAKIDALRKKKRAKGRKGGEKPDATEPPTKKPDATEPPKKKQDATEPSKKKQHATEPPKKKQHATEPPTKKPRQQA